MENFFKSWKRFQWKLDTNELVLYTKHIRKTVPYRHIVDVCPLLVYKKKPNCLSIETQEKKYTLHFSTSEHLQGLLKAIKKLRQEGIPHS